jgi:predicted nucleic acid-binding protein
VRRVGRVRLGPSVGKGPRGTRTRLRADPIYAYSYACERRSCFVTTSSPRLALSPRSTKRPRSFMPVSKLSLRMQRPSVLERWAGRIRQRPRGGAVVAARLCVVLVDSSVWIAHLRAMNSELVKLLDAGLVRTHPWVIGELACGTLRRRHEFLQDMDRLPATPVATHLEMRTLVERERLMGHGLGWIDVALLASARLGGVRLWTKDRPLRAAAHALRVGYPGKSS